MRVRRAKLALALFSLTLLAGSAAMLFWCAAVPPARPSELDQALKLSAPTAPPSADTSFPPLADFTAVWEKRWRKPLQDPPPAAPVPTPQISVPATQLKLVGTVIEPEHSMAMFQLPGGAIEVRAIGEIVDARGAKAEILSIERGTVELRFADQVKTLTLTE